MEPTKEILSLLRKRTKAGNNVNKYDVAVRKWCDKHNVNVMDIESDFGCMVVTEPDNYEAMFIKRINETEI